MESAVEIKDNVAAFACAKVLVDPVAAEHIAARGGGAVAGDPGGKSVTACPRRAGMTLFTSCTRRRLRWRTSGKKPLTIF